MLNAHISNFEMAPTDHCFIIRFDLSQICSQQPEERSPITRVFFTNKKCPNILRQSPINLKTKFLQLSETISVCEGEWLNCIQIRCVVSSLLNTDNTLRIQGYYKWLWWKKNQCIFKTDWNTWSRKGAGTHGRGFTVDGVRGARNLLLLEPQGGVQSSSSPSCNATSESWDGGAVMDYTRDRASVTTLSCPDIYHMSDVNWAMK
jgi:hypothetical protein